VRIEPDPRNLLAFGTLRPSLHRRPGEGGGSVDSVNRWGCRRSSYTPRCPGSSIRSAYKSEA
jgi:hypothetical protein